MEQTNQQERNNILPMSELNSQTGGELTDEQLLELYRGGQMPAFEKLVERYRVDLFRFLLRFTNNPAAADDLFQESFLQVHISADTFDTNRRFRPWLFTIAANKARDSLRKNVRRKEMSLSAGVSRTGDDDSQSFVDLMEADLPLPDDDAQKREAKEQVGRVVAEMPDHLREVLLLAYFHQFPYKEIAEMLSIPLGTVKSRLHSAVATFARMWKQTYGEDYGEKQ